MEDRLFAKNLKKPQGEIGKAVGKIMNDINAFITRHTYSLMELKSNETILEIGFGNGKFIKEIFDDSIDIHYKGIDISDVMVEEAVKLNKDLINREKVELKIGDSKDIPYSKDSFDKVCLINTIYFWETPTQDLKEIYRVLRNDGNIYISIRSKEKLKNDSFTKFYFKLYEYSEIREMLLKAGFRDIKCEQKLEPGKEEFLDVFCIIAKK
jgi:ubiquinone/menaquinone biosynthesis C-methylase UbiE